MTMIGSITRSPNYKTKGDSLRVAHLDASTHSQIVMDYPEHELIRGHVFHHASFESIAADSNKYFYIDSYTNSSAGQEFFVEWSMSSTQNFTVKVYGGSVPADEGDIPTTPPVINLRIGDTSTNYIIFRMDGAIGAGDQGTLIAQHYVPSGSGLFTAGRGSKTSTPILDATRAPAWFDIHNESGTSAMNLSWTFTWWEQTPKDTETE